MNPLMRLSLHHFSLWKPNQFRSCYLEKKTFSIKPIKENPKTNVSSISSNQNSEILLRTCQAISSSNEVKLIRLTIEMIIKKSSTLFENHVVKNPSFQDFLSLLKFRIEKLQITTDKSPRTIQKKNISCTLKKETENNTSLKVKKVDAKISDSP
ncbi:uncharacterized protein LOC129912214 isoform X2 [Episyrphus balteatus]|uniref:uncharacterized protein LOC129912214 isoform X2 n=1 Tax=Episyrphus balteatus TaxID=286459 RepID=UPI002485263F|nr:uncharacterized protein LOC129912214 isoform X2 [Episyrphus balteatus]